MQQALRLQTTVLPGHRIEVSAAELPVGSTVEVIVMLPTTATAPPSRTILDFLEALPPGPRSYPTWEQFEREFQAEREAWDR